MDDIFTHPDFAAFKERTAGMSSPQQLFEVSVRPRGAAIPCGRCGHPVAHFWFKKGLLHCAHGQRSTRGCRAASLDRLGHWDDTIPQSWTAKGTPWRVAAQQIIRAMGPS